MSDQDSTKHDEVNFLLASRLTIHQMDEHTLYLLNLYTHRSILKMLKRILLPKAPR